MSKLRNGVILARTSKVPLTHRQSRARIIQDALNILLVEKDAEGNGTSLYEQHEAFSLAKPFKEYLVAIVRSISPSMAAFRLRAK